MTHQETRKIIDDFYTFYNNSDFDKLFLLIGDNIIHQVNYVETQGKQKFMDYIITSKKHYEEYINNYLFMISDDNTSVTTQFTVKGKYIQTDDSGIAATGQPYELAVMNFFLIKNHQIVKGCSWFNEDDWIKQVSGKLT